MTDRRPCPRCSSASSPTGSAPDGGQPEYHRGLSRHVPAVAALCQRPQAGRRPSSRIEDLDAELIADFLAHVETVRHNSARSRNTRLAAIRSFFRFVAMNEPAYLLHCQRILAMPGKRYVQRDGGLPRPRGDGCLAAAPDRSTWVGRRDHAILLVALQTGLRVSELINLRALRYRAGHWRAYPLRGKGRKQRCTPLRRDTVSCSKHGWRASRRTIRSVFPTIRGEQLSRDAVEASVRKYSLTASRSCASLTGKRVSPHVLQTQDRYGIAPQRRRSVGHRALART